MEERHLSLGEVAGVLSKNERTIRRWIKSGKLRAYKPGRDYLIPESAVGELLEGSEVFPKGLAPPLPLEDAEWRGAEEPEEGGPYYNAFEAIGRLLAMNWKEELAHWEEKIPEGETPASFKFGRLLQWALDIGGVRAVYAAMARERDVLQRAQLEDTLRMMEEAERASIEKVKRVFEPAKDYADFREMWEANDMDAVFSEAESRDTPPTGPSRRIYVSGGPSWAEQAADPTGIEAPTEGA